MTTRSSAAENLALLNQFLTADFDYFVRPRYRWHHYQQDNRRRLRKNCDDNQRLGPVQTAHQLPHWQRLFSLPAEYLTSCVPNSPIRYTMPEVTKVFDSVDKLKADGSNYRIWIARVKACIRACQTTVLLTTQATTEVMIAHLNSKMCHVS